MKKVTLTLLLVVLLVLSACTNSGEPFAHTDTPEQNAAPIKPTVISTPTTVPTQTTEEPGYTFHFSYEAAFETDTLLKVTFYVTNLGPDIEYRGTPFDLFSVVDLYCQVDGKMYKLDSGMKAYTDDATLNVFRTNETFEYTEDIYVPEDAPAGLYDLSFAILGEVAIFEDAVAIHTDATENT